MSKWSATIANDPCNDYALLIEIEYGDDNKTKDVSLIRQERNGISLRWYAYAEYLRVPFKWFVGLMREMIEINKGENEFRGISNDHYKDDRVEFDYPLHLIRSFSNPVGKLKKENWEAPFINDLERSLSINGEVVAYIEKEKEEMCFVVYPHDETLFIPFDWLLDVVNDIEKKLELIEEKSNDALQVSDA